MGVMAALVAPLLLAGCAGLETPLDDGYDLGDGSRVVLGTAGHLFSLRHAYCLSSSSELREGLLERIHEVRPGYPEQGICADFLGVAHAG